MNISIGVNVVAICPDIKVRNALIRAIQEKFKEHIYSADYYIVRDELKLNLFPSGMLEESKPRINKNVN